jgi:hypothetical protein
MEQCITFATTFIVNSSQIHQFTFLFVNFYVRDLLCRIFLQKKNNKNDDMLKIDFVLFYKATKSILFCKGEKSHFWVVPRQLTQP